MDYVSREYFKSLPCQEGMKPSSSGRVQLQRMVCVEEMQGKTMSWTLSTEGSECHSKISM